MIYYTIVRRGEDRAARDRARGEGLARLLPLFGAPAGARLLKDEQGRPFLPDFPSLDVSVSHADGLTVVAVGTTRLGVDLECTARMRDPLGMARRFFTEGEQAEVLAAADKTLAATGVWTRKEAFGKREGSGLAAALGECTATRGGGCFRTCRIEDSGKRFLLTFCADEEAIPVACDHETVAIPT